MLFEFIDEPKAWSKRQYLGPQGSWSWLCSCMFIWIGEGDLCGNIFVPVLRKMGGRTNIVRLVLFKTPSPAALRANGGQETMKIMMWTQNLNISMNDITIKNYLARFRSWVYTYKKVLSHKYKFIIFSFFKYHQYFLVSSGINEGMEIFGHKAYGVELPITAVTVEMGNMLQYLSRWVTCWVSGRLPCSVS